MENFILCVMFIISDYSIITENVLTKTNLRISVN